MIKNFALIPWKYSVRLKEQETLFSVFDNEKYEVDAYSCSCGYEDFVISKEHTNVKYQCNSCKNVDFYNANEILNNFENYCKRNDDIEFYFLYDDVKFLNNILSLSCFVKIPYEIDIVKEKIYFKQLDIFKIEIDSKGKIKKSFLMNICEDRLKMMKNQLEKYVKDNNINFQYIKELDYNLYKFISSRSKEFFYENKNLQDSDFIYWKNYDLLKLDNQISIINALSVISNHRTEKSVKKAVYNIHEKSISDRKDFNPVFVNAFTKTIKDTNILVKLLKLNLYRNSEYTGNELIEFILFLKKNKYSEIQIYDIFKNEVSVTHFLDDVIRDTMFYMKKEMNNFKKVKANLIVIHNELVKCTFEKRFQENENIDKNINYLNNEKIRCINIDKYCVLLPKNGIELFYYAKKLNNCMASYFEDIYRGFTCIYIFKFNNEVKFAVEIQDNKLIQLSGDNNCDLDKEEKKVLNKWKKIFKII